MDDPFARLSRAIARKPWLVVGVWVVLLLACAALWPRAETVVKTSGFELPDTQAARAGAVLDREFGPSAGRGAVVVYHSAIRTVDSGAYRRDVVASTARIRGIGAVRSILTFFNTGDPSLVSRDRHTTLALVDFKSDDDPTVIAAVRQRLRHLSVSADVTGNLAIQQDTFSTSQDDLRRFEIIAMPVLLILLVVVFRTVVAASMPLVLGACSVTMATALIALVGSLFDVSVFALNVASMIGLGLGIDFSLVLISRFRQEMAAGLRPDEALPRTMATAGRSVTFSAITVMLCMLVMTLFMHDFMILRSISMGVMLVAFTSILAALTLLPAVLSLLGHRIEALPVLRLRRRAARGGPGAWYRLSHAIMRRPWSWLAMALLLLAVLALPARDLRTEVETTGALPGTAESARGAQLIGDAFGPGRLTPIQIVLQTSPNGVWTPQFLGVLQQLTDTALADPRTQSVQSLSTLARAAGIPAASFASLSRESVTAHPALARKAPQVVNLEGASDVALITIVPRTGEFAASHQALVRDLRDRIIPAMPQLDPYRVLVGGEAANSIDFHQTVYGRFPLIVGMVLLTTFIILLMFFQSITLPLKATFMNLATMAATYGVLVAVFQYGWGAGLLGFASQGMLDIVTPVIVYAVLFALSTDYEVFMLSRVKEYYHELHDNTEAVAAGLQNTGGMITAAGLILIVTFAAFVTANVVTLKEIGLGLAVGVLLDSTVVRIVLVPATMRLMGDRNWWMPARLKGVVPELREAPALQPVAAASSPDPAATMALAPAILPGSPPSRPTRGVRDELVQATPGPRLVGLLRPLGASIGADLVTLPRARPLRIGRDEANELQLYDEHLSPFHGRIDYVNGRFVITDLKSRTGIYINGHRIAEYQRIPLKPGDEIRIGTLDRVTFTFDLAPVEESPYAGSQGLRDVR